MAVGIDHPPNKLFIGAIPKSETSETDSSGTHTDKESSLEDFRYTLKVEILRDVIIWSALWCGCVLLLCIISLGRADEVWKMLSEYE